MVQTFDVSSYPSQKKIKVNNQYKYRAKSINALGFYEQISRKDPAKINNQISLT